MSPRRRTARSRVLAAAVGVALGGALLWGVAVYASRGHGKGDLEIKGEFRVGHAEALVDQVPFLLPDATPGRAVDIYVQHLGPESEFDEGWLVFSAFAPGQTDRDCFLGWDGEVFEDPCTGATFPPDGTGLTRYPTRVDEDHRLYVDLTPE